MRNMTMDDLWQMATNARDQWPRAEVVKNQVGNLNVYVGDEWVAWLDLRTGDINRQTDETP